MDRPQPRRERRVAAREPAEPEGGELAAVRSLVERAQERGEPGCARRVEQMRARLRGEDRGGELAHSVSSAGGR